MATAGARKTVSTKQGGTAAKPLQTTGKTFVVGCKTALGLNVGHLHGESRPVVIFHGANHKNAVVGVGRTYGVDKDAFEAWMKKNYWLPAVKNGLIFGYESDDYVREEAKDKRDLKHGFEPVDPRKPGKGIKPTDEQVKELDKIDGEADDGDE